MLSSFNFLAVMDCATFITCEEVTEAILSVLCSNYKQQEVWKMCPVG